jgi:hypothetical protein
MNNKDRHLPMNLILIQQRKVSLKKSQTKASLGTIKIKLLNAEQAVPFWNSYPFDTELPEIEEEDIAFETWICRECEKDASENCNCCAGFKKVETIFKCWCTKLYGEKKLLEN